MEREALWADVMGALASGPGVPERRASNAERASAAELRHRMAWQRIIWAINGQSALLELRDELLDDIRKLGEKAVAQGGLMSSQLELLDRLSLRETQVREVLAAFLTQGKVLLDLLSQAVAATLGEARGFKMKHGAQGIGVRLDDYADTLKLVRPDAPLVDLARELDVRLADLRDDLIVHPRLEGTYGRAYVQRTGRDLAIQTLFPEVTGEPPPVIPIDELDAMLATYTRDLTRWVSSALATE